MSRSREAEDIRRQMAEIRQSLHDDIEEIVDNARFMTDWHYYVSRYPWACAGLAAAVGYLVVPKRLEIISPDAETIARLARKNQLVVKAQPEPRARGGMAGTLLQLLANTALRAGVAYLGHRASKMVSPEGQREPS